MAIPNIDRVTKFDESGIATLNKILEDNARMTPNQRYTDTEPTIKDVGQGDVVIYDNGLTGGSSVKRLYFRTGKDNLGYVTLT